MDGSNDGNLYGSRLGVSLGSNDRFILGTDERIKLGSPDGEVLGITLGDDDGTEIGSLDCAFDGKIVSGLIRDVATLLGTDEEWSCLGLLDGKVLGFSVVGSQHSQLSYPFPPSKQLC